MRRSERPRAAPSHTLTDGDGLYLLVTPAGARYWRMNYRYLGKQKTLAFGVWPDTGLAEARERAMLRARCWREATIPPSR